MTSLAEIRAKIAAQSNNNTQNQTKSDNAIYPFWNMDTGNTATLRFLEDADPENPFFWVERNVIKLPFNGIKGDPTSKPFMIQIPCVEMYGDKCPILAEVRPWYKDETLKPMANRYWKKKTYLFQGFVRANPIAKDEAPANPIRRFIITPQIFPNIQTGLLDPEMTEMPTSHTQGLDFIIRKTPNGAYDSYATSNYARKETPLTEAELAAIEAHGLFNLKDYLPNKPTETELRIAKEMFEASVDGQDYDPAKWASYYRPYGWTENGPSEKSSSYDSTTSSVQVPSNYNSSSETVVESDDSVDDEVSEVVIPTTPAPAASTTSVSSNAQDILEKIRMRKSNIS